MLHSLNFKALKIAVHITLVVFILIAGVLTVKFFEFRYPNGKEGNLMDLLFIELVIWDIGL